MCTTRPLTAPSPRSLRKIRARSSARATAASPEDRPPQAGREVRRQLPGAARGPCQVRKHRDGECWLDSELSKAIDVPVYGTAQAAYARTSSSFKDVRLAPGDQSGVRRPRRKQAAERGGARRLIDGHRRPLPLGRQLEGPPSDLLAGLLYTVPPRSNKTAKKLSSKKDTPAKRPSRRRRPRRAPAPLVGRRRAARRRGGHQTRRPGGGELRRAARRARWRTPRPRRSGKLW